MATLKQNSIDVADIKIRWEEPYSSEGINRIANINSPGVYRGGIVKAKGTPDQTFDIDVSAQGDSVMLVQDDSNGFSNAVRFDALRNIDMSAAVTWPISGDHAWYVWVQVLYTLSPPTVGNIMVTDVAPTDNKCLLAVIDMPNGATTILDEYIRTDGSARTKPSIKDGIVVRKWEEITPPGPDMQSFQISDRVYLADAYSVPSSAGLTMVLLTVPTLFKLTGSDYGLVTVDLAYKDAGLTQAIIEADLDEDGCYTSPYIRMGFADTVDIGVQFPFTVGYYSFVPLDEVSDTDSYPRTGVEGHATKTLAKTLPGTPDSLSLGTVTSQLLSLLGLVNGRIRNPAPVTGSTWILLWRSDGIVLDSNVVNGTQSIYYKEEGFIYVTGGYMDTTVIPGVDKIVVSETNEPCSFFMLRGNILEISGRTTIKAADDSLDPFSESDWETYNNKSAGVSKKYRQTFKLNDSTVDSTDSSVTGSHFFPIYKHKAAGIFFRGDVNSSSAIFITFNCEYDEGSSVWKAIDNSLDASAFAIEDLGFVMYRKSINDGIASGWAQSSSGWTTRVTFCADPTSIGSNIGGLVGPANTAVFGCPIVTGAVYERIIAGGATVYGLPDPSSLPLAINFREVWETVPTSAVWESISETNVDSVVYFHNGSGGNYTMLGGWGGVLVVTGSLSANNKLSWYGMVEVYST